MSADAAEYIRDVPPNESMDDSVQDAKALTFEHFREHAMLKLEDGRQVLIRGGPYGIELKRSVPKDPFGRPGDQLWIEVGGRDQMVAELIFHVHPKVTGPSDSDLVVMALLQQKESMLYELFGPAEGTIIRPKDRSIL